MSFSLINKKEPAETVVDNIFITDHMPGASAVQIKVYLYGLMLCARGTDKGADAFARDLGISADEAEAAFEYWQQQKLVVARCIIPI